MPRLIDGTRKNSRYDLWERARSANKSAVANVCIVVSQSVNDAGSLVGISRLGYNRPICQPTHEADSQQVAYVVVNPIGNAAAPADPGEVTEWPIVRHWKCRVGVKPHRGFESRPLR